MKVSARVLVVLLGVAACGCSSAAPKASPATSSESTTTSTNADTSTTGSPTSSTAVIASTSSSSVPVAAVLAGTWESHGIGLTIDGQGHGTLVWRTYRDCSTDAPPCDTFQGSDIIDGGHATLTLASVDAPQTTGQILTSTVPEQVPIGPATARFDPVHDELYLSPSTALNERFCGPNAPTNDCGA